MNRQQLGLWGTFAFATLAVVGMFVQVYLIGGYIFGETGWLSTHKDLGKLVHLFYVLTFVAALVGAWPNWRSTGWPFALAAVGTVQAFLAGRGDIDDGSNAAAARVPRGARPDRLRDRAHDRVAHLEDAPGHGLDRDGRKHVTATRPAARGRAQAARRWRRCLTTSTTRPSESAIPSASSSPRNVWFSNVFPPKYPSSAAYDAQMQPAATS